MSCRCDLPRTGGEPDIPAGLSSLPRAIGGFGEFREAMLAAVPGIQSLSGWRARGDADLGLLLLEMGAVVFDSLAFYDEVFANEAYLRTATRRASLRKLAALVGFVPRPAVSASVSLAVLVSGRKGMVLRRGTAFRSRAFPGGAPQVFEVDADTAVHPFLNRLEAIPPPAPSSAVDRSSFLALQSGTRATAGDLVLLTGRGGVRAARKITALSPVAGAGGTKLVRIALSDPGLAAPQTRLAAFVDLVHMEVRDSAHTRSDKPPEVPHFLPDAKDADVIRLQRATQKAILWTGPGAGPSASTIVLPLNTLYRSITAGDDVIVTAGEAAAAFRVGAVRETSFRVIVGSGDGKDFAAQVPVTSVTLDGTWPFGEATLAAVTLHFGFSEVSREAEQPGTVLEMQDRIALRPVEAPAGRSGTGRFLLQDAEGATVDAVAALDADRAALTRVAPAGGGSWGPLRAPVSAYGNVVVATQGETVAQEVLGSGDASQANQQFQLQKKPLTYVVPEGASKPSSSLQIRVDGILWYEVPSFFGRPRDARLYVVRTADDGTAWVTFGDGNQGARLPTGARNVVASYRFGAGATSPPAGSIDQISSAVPGLLAVKDPLGAAGGADAQPGSALRTYAPRSALVLGRAVSIADMEALAAAAPGVRAVRSEWAWSPGMQRAAVTIWYIGAQTLRGQVRNAVRGESDPWTSIDAQPARPIGAELGLGIEVDASSYREEEVLPRVRTALTAPETGPLSPERIGIGVPLFFSRIISSVLAVPGVAAVTMLTWNGSPPGDFAVAPPAGAYFDLETSGDLVLNGKGSHG